ncbi:MAG: hypothetical protein KDA24_05785 [Deltaproteobacteria bacterium]|nr:hypothetical protein [Deltaproteobacteria bacterium]
MRLMPLIVLGSSLLAGCVPNLLSGEVDGNGFDVVEAVHFEFRGTDPGTSLPIHPLTVWMMPVEDSCTAWPQLAEDMRALRAQLDGGQDPNDFCVEWADRWAEFSGGEPFWISQIRLQAQPRGEEETPATDYPYLDEDGETAPSGPWFDATFAWHDAPTLERCAAIFEGTDYVPQQFVATAGNIVVKSYTVDEALQGTIVMDVEAQGDDPISGAFESTFCPAAGDFDLTSPLLL